VALEGADPVDFVETLARPWARCPTLAEAVGRAHDSFDSLGDRLPTRIARRGLSRIGQRAARSLPERRPANRRAGMLVQGRPLARNMARESPGGGVASPGAPASLPPNRADQRGGAPNRSSTGQLLGSVCAGPSGLPATERGLTHSPAGRWSSDRHRRTAPHQPASRQPATGPWLPASDGGSAWAYGRTSHHGPVPASCRPQHVTGSAFARTRRSRPVSAAQAAPWPTWCRSGILDGSEANAAVGQLGQ
jgi:hypothetical protein